MAFNLVEKYRNNGMSQSAIAKLLDVSPRTLRSWRDRTNYDENYDNLLRDQIEKYRLKGHK